MAQKIKHRRGSVATVRSIPAFSEGEVIIGSGSIDDKVVGPIVYIGKPGGTTSANDYTPVSKLYAGSGIPSITPAVFGTTADGLPYYDTNGKKLYILGAHSDGTSGHTAITLTSQSIDNFNTVVSASAAIAGFGGAVAVAGTVSGSVQIDHDSTTNFVANEHIDWTSDQGGTNIHSGNYTDTNTTYSVGDGGLTTNDFTNADHTKLNAIELLADVTDATNVTSAGALMDSEVTALALIKSLTAADISGSTTALSSSIASDVATNTAKVTNVSTNLTKTVSGTGFAINSSDGDNIALSLADTNNWGLMSDEMFDKLDGIEASADVTDATNVLANLPDGVISGSAQLPAGISIPDGTVSGSIQVDIHNTTGYVANEHLDWTSNVGTIHSGNYTDTTTNTQLSQEQVEDFVGGMLGGTETGITVTYQDSTGDIDFVVATQTANDFTNTLKSKLDAIEALADVTTATNVLSSLVASDLVVGTITAESYVISSSVTHMTTSFSSGSTIFGDDILDTHQMTGSLYVSGSVFFTEIDGGNF
jgi:hypothetical protein